MSDSETKGAFMASGRKPGFLFAVAIMIFTVGVLWRGCQGPETPRTERSTVMTTTAPAHLQMYTCSMHPQVRSPDPDAKCPICAMDLIPVPVDDDQDESDAPQLRLSERAAALMEIRTWPVERRQIEMEISLFGKIGFDESRLYDVVARTESYVERLKANTPWQQVAKGEVLAEFYSPSVASAMRELLVARDGAQGGQAAGNPGDGIRNEVLEATRSRLIRMGVTDGQVSEILQSGEAPREFRVVSPSAGVALPASVREGEWLREGALLVRIADVSRVWVNLEAYERDLYWLGIGMPVSFTVVAHPGHTFEGLISFIDPVVNESTRTVRLRVEADNQDGLLKPGMLATARVRAAYPAPGNTSLLNHAESRGQPGPDHNPDEHKHPASSAIAPPHMHASTRTLPLVIPASAPLITGKRGLVYVRLPDTDRPTFEPREVVLGPRAGDFYILDDGLEEGDLVVVNGAFKIDSELQIRGRPSMMAAEGRTPPSDQHRHESDMETRPESDAVLKETRLQTHCPVMGGAINREFYHDHDGQRIYVCCPGCLDEVRERAAEIIREQRELGIVFERVEE